MPTVIVDNTLHKPVSNRDAKPETTVSKQSPKSELVTLPEKASTVSNLIERERYVTKITETSPVLLPDAAVASFGNRKMLEVVIGDDDREAVTNVLATPWKKIAALRIKAKNGLTYVGTAWFISPTVLATAGHCVFMHDEGGWPASIEVIPALDGTQRFFGSVVSQKFESSDGWVNDRNSDYDYGVIILDQPVDERIGYFGFAPASDSQLNCNIANISGYPADLDRATKQYYHARKIIRSSSRRLYYEIDTYGGQSGSPVWMTIQEGQRIAVGIHTTGNSTSNYGTRITDEVFKNLENWKKL
jgi:V8-like Glu-specific endopeptidase